MPVTVSQSSIVNSLGKIARRFIPNTELAETKVNVIHFGTEIGYHQYNTDFTAEITVAPVKKDTVIKLTAVNTKVDILIKIAEAFCAEEFDCNFQV